MLLRFTSPFDVSGSTDHHAALRLHRQGIAGRLPARVAPAGGGPFTARGTCLPTGDRLAQAPAASLKRGTPTTGSGQRHGLRPATVKNSIMNRRGSPAARRARPTSSPRRSRASSTTRSGPIRSRCCHQAGRPRGGRDARRVRGRIKTENDLPSEKLRPAVPEPAERPDHGRGRREGRRARRVHRVDGAARRATRAAPAA